MLRVHAPARPDLAASTHALALALALGACNGGDAASATLSSSTSSGATSSGATSSGATSSESSGDPVICGDGKIEGAEVCDPPTVGVPPETPEDVVRCTNACVETFPSALIGQCPLAWGGATEVHTDVEGAPFTATRAFFGVDFNNQEGLILVLFPAGPPLESPFIEGVEPRVRVEVAPSTWLPDGFLGAFTALAGVYSGGGVYVSLPDLEVTVTARLGNWDAYDPDDPPRLVGELSGAAAGPFEAAYCEGVSAYPSWS